MRIGSFQVKGANGRNADISVVLLSGEAGGDLANINRWRGQISLSPIDAANLSKESKTISPAGRSMLFINFANQNKRLMAAIYRSHERTWFFKMTGDDDVVAAEKTSFLRFLQSLKFNDDQTE